MTTWFYPGQEDYITKLNELGAIAELLSGPDGWSPELAVVPDGERRVFQVADWVGGETTKPPIGDYVGSTGYVSNIADAIDIRGPRGVAGADGAAGPSNVLSIGTVTGGATASAAITGTSPSQVLNLVLPKGDPGTNGTDGLAATITVGTVTTGAPGTSATVVNSGTSSAAVFDFTIPRGNTGAAGSGSGDVVGPASATNNGVALFDGTTGKIIKDGGVLGTAAFKAATSFATAAQGTKADTAVQPGSLATVATSGAYADLTGKPTLGTASTLNVPTTGNAAAGEVVKGDDTRLSDSRTPTGTAGGVLSGSYPNPDFAVDMATQAELDAVSSVANAKLSDAPSDGKTYGRKDAAWAEVGGGDGYATGDVLTTASTLAAPDWLEAGNVYLQSSYAALYAKLGLVNNGFTATSGTLPSTGEWAGIAYGNGVFVAVKWGITGAFATSPDGVTWTPYNAPSDQTWSGVAYGAGLFVAISGGSAASTVFATSPDGITWTRRTVPSSTHGDICFGAGRFVVVPYTAASTVALTSTDGISWTTTSVPSAAAVRRSVAFGNGLFVLVGGAGSAQVCATSPDGVTWTARSLPSNGNWMDVSYGAGLFVAVALGSASFATSPDGVVWKLRQAPGSFNWSAVVFGVGGFLACPNTSDGYAYSANGLTWNLTPVTGGGSELEYANGVFVSVNSGTTTARRLIPYTYDTATQFYVPPANGVGAPYRQYVKA